MEQDPEGGEARGLPGTLTGTCAPGECAELPKGCSTHGDPEKLGGLGGGSAEGAARPGSANPTAQAPEHRGRDTAQDPASPGTGRDREGPGQQGRSCPS